MWCDVSAAEVSRVRVLAALASHEDVCQALSLLLRSWGDAAQLPGCPEPQFSLPENRRNVH